VSAAVPGLGEVDGLGVAARAVEGVVVVGLVDGEELVDDFVAVA
jgi:hypothetical protein